MSYSVVKIGGSICVDERSAHAIRAIVRRAKGPTIFVISALRGVSDEIISLLEGDGLEAAQTYAKVLRERHCRLARSLAKDDAAFEAIRYRLFELERSFLLVWQGGRRDRYERLLSFGERFSALTLCAALPRLDAAFVLPEEVALPAAPGPTGRRDGVSLPRPECAAKLKARLDALTTIAMPGFYGVGAKGEVVLFGRGGSDYSAAVLARAIGAECCEIVKEGQACRSADPKTVEHTSGVKRLSYREAEELAASGAKLLHPGAARVLSDAGIALRICSSDYSEITVVDPDGSRTGPKVITSRAGKSDPTPVSIIGNDIAYAVEHSKRAFRALSNERIAPLGVTCAPDGVRLSIFVDPRRADRALKALHAEFFPNARSEQ